MTSPAIQPTQPTPVATTKRSPRIVTPEAKQQQAEFADRLGRAMQLKGLSQSDLAREVWGSTKDARGYSVARNRDRISAYLAGAGVPEPENLKKLADALDVKIEDLVSWDPAKPLTSRASRAQAEFSLMQVAGQPGVVLLRIEKTLPMEIAVQIIQLAEKY